MPLEVLHRAFVLFRGGAGAEGAEVAALAGLRVHLARIQAELTVPELANHRPANLPRGLRAAFAFFFMDEGGDFARDTADAAPPLRPPLRMGEWSSAFPHPPPPGF